ncbi:MAG: hypothetical protein ACFFC7_14735 [Candidatus Hermodarchaeota archaeon]
MDRNALEKDISNSDLIIRAKLSPWSSHPNDQTVLLNQLNVTIIWYIYNNDSSLGLYSVYLNNYPIIVDKIWTNGTACIVSVDTSVLGLWNYTIVFADADNNPGIPDIVLINVVTENGDVDNDGLNNYYELNVYYTDPNNPDTDGDGLTDGIEVIIFKTNATKSDTDNDMMPDGWEVIYNFNPLNTTDATGDADSDGLTNYQEYTNRTNPRNNDTDEDGMKDGWEISNMLNPLINDSSEDPDQDELINLHEFHYGTNPQQADTDTDGFSDNEEIKQGTDPRNPLDNQYSRIIFVIISGLILVVAISIGIGIYRQKKFQRPASTKIASKQQPEVSEDIFEELAGKSIFSDEAFKEYLNQKTAPIGPTDLYQNQSPSIDKILAIYDSITSDNDKLNDSKIWHSFQSITLPDIFTISPKQLLFLAKNLNRLTKIQTLTKELVQIHEKILSHYPISNHTLKSYLDFLLVTREKFHINKTLLQSRLKTVFYSNEKSFFDVDIRRKCNQLLLDKVGIVVDGNNVAKHNNKTGYNKKGRHIIIAEVKLLKLLYEQLKSIFPPENILIFVSAALEYTIDDIKLFNELKKDRIVEITPAGESDDFFCLNTAHNLNYFILSRDLFTDWKINYPYLAQLIDQWRITFMFDRISKKFTFSDKVLSFLDKIAKPIKIDQITEPISEIALKARIKQIQELIPKKSHTLICRLIIYDETGIITLALGNEHKDVLNFQEGQEIILEKAFAKEYKTRAYKNKLQLQLRPKGKIIPLKTTNIPDDLPISKITNINLTQEFVCAEGVVLEVTKQMSSTSVNVDIQDKTDHIKLIGVGKENSMKLATLKKNTQIRIELAIPSRNRRTGEKELLIEKLTTIIPLE